MSDQDIRNALAENLMNSGVDQNKIDWEDSSFNPLGLDYYVDFNVFDSTEIGAGKTLADTSEQNGFLQIRVYRAMNSNDRGILMRSVIDMVKAAFLSGSETSYNGQVVAILDSNGINPTDSESWRQGGLTINYRAFKERV